MAIDSNILLRGIIPDAVASARAGFQLGRDFKRAPLIDQLDQQKLQMQEQGIAEGEMDLGSKFAGAVASIAGDQPITANNYAQTLAAMNRLGLPIEEENRIPSAENIQALEQIRQAGARSAMSGKQFADKAVFTTRLNPETGEIEQGFAVRDESGTRFEGIEGQVVKETPEEKRQRDLESKQKLEQFKTDQEFLREYNKQTQTPKGKAELEKIKREQLRENATKTAETMRAADALNTLNGLSQSDLGKIYGRGESVYPALLRSQEGLDMIASRDQVVSILKLMGRGELKGQGTVSDIETKMLGDAATILSMTDISPEKAAEEIERIRPVFERVLREGGREVPRNGSTAADRLKEAKARAGVK